MHPIIDTTTNIQEKIDINVFTKCYTTRKPCLKNTDFQ